MSVGFTRRSANSLLHVNLNASQLTDNRPTVLMDTGRVAAILAPGESRDINGEISVRWKNVPEVSGAKYLPITVTVFCWDSTSIRHETRYQLFVDESFARAGGSGSIAPGVMLTSRTTTSRAVWRLKVASRVQ